MKLLLFSQAPLKNFKEQFEAFFSVPAHGKLAFIPNARDEVVAQQKQQRLLSEVGFDVEEIDLLKITGQALKEKLMQKRVIFMDGGFCNRLIHAVNESGLRSFFPELLENGLLYVGSSAGSMIASPRLETAEWFIGEEEPGASKLAGLGYVRFNIYPHFRKELQEQVQKFLKPDEKYYFLYDGQALGVKDGKEQLIQ